MLQHERKNKSIVILTMYNLYTRDKIYKKANTRKTKIIDHKTRFYAEGTM